MAVVDKEAEVASPTKRKEVIKRLFGKKEKFPVVEIPQIPEIPPEIEKAQPVPGASTQLTKPVTDDQTGQVLVTSTTAQTPQITLPLTDEEIEQGLQDQIINSIRWLAEWCFRWIKKLGGTIKKKKIIRNPQL